MWLRKKKEMQAKPESLPTHYGWYVRWYDPLSNRWTASNRWFMDFPMARAMARRKAATTKVEYVEVVRFKTEESEDWDG